MEKRTERPSKVRPSMAAGSRAKIFAPFESLGSMEEMLKEVEMNTHIGELEHVDIENPDTEGVQGGRQI